MEYFDIKYSLKTNIEEILHWAHYLSYWATAIQAWYKCGGKISLEFIEVFV